MQRREREQFSQFEAAPDADAHSYISAVCEALTKLDCVGENRRFIGLKKNGRSCESRCCREPGW